MTSGDGGRVRVVEGGGGGGGRRSLALVVVVVGRGKENFSGGLGFCLGSWAWTGLTRRGCLTNGVYL